MQLSLYKVINIIRNWPEFQITCLNKNMFFFLYKYASILNPSDFTFLEVVIDDDDDDDDDSALFYDPYI